MAVSPELQASTDEQIRAKIAFGNPLALRGLLYHLTGDGSVEKVAHEPHGPGLFADNEPYISDPADIAKLREKAADLLIAYRDGRFSLPKQVAKERLHRAMSLAVCQEIPDKELDFWLEELALDPSVRSLKWKQRPDPEKLKGFEVVVIGAGLGGTHAAIQLKQAGFPCVVFEKNPGAGGVWQQNRYPGARVDLPSRLYSHALAVDYPFTATFAPQADTEKYVNWCIDSYGIRDRIHFSSEVIAARWNEKSAEWHLDVRHGDGKQKTYRARAIISAVGFLDRPQFPDVLGLESFQGKKLHTTQMSDAVPLSGLRVAVVGTGASGMQMVPIIAPQVESLTVFQRSPAWVLPVPGYRDPLPVEVLWLNANLPFYTNWTRFIGMWATCGKGFYEVFTADPNWHHPLSTSATNESARQKFVAHIQRELKDRPDLLAKCMPDYPPFSKRFVVDNGWFETLKRKNVQLVTAGISHFTESALVTKDGEKFELDVVIFATGFRANDYFWPMEIVGRGGVDLGRLWAKDGARAYLGVSMPHMPNFFCIYGPNTNPRVNGPVPWGEMQTRYALECFQGMVANGWDALEVTTAAYDRYNVQLDEALSKTNWMDPRTRSYYRNRFDRSAVMAPWGGYEYWSMVRHPNFDDYRELRASERPNAG